MKWVLIIILIFLPVTLQAQEYEVKKRCMGNGTHAIVVEYSSQYYVVETPRYFQHNWVIVDLLGISLGGPNTLYYASSAGANHSIEVNVLSRFRWRYAGYPGARAVCRQVTQGHFGNSYGVRRIAI